MTKKFDNAQEERDFLTAQRGNRQPKENEYMGEDGYIHCKDCDERIESILLSYTSHGPDYALIPTRNCACVRAKREKEKAQTEQEKLNDRLDTAFAEFKSYRYVTFANDDQGEPEVGERVRRFVDYTDDFLHLPQEKQCEQQCPGLLLYGETGGGKTTMAAMACHALCERGIQPYMFSIINIAGQMRTQEKEVLEWLCGFRVWFVDDYGAERDTEWMQEKVLLLIETAIRNNIVLFVTSNLTAEKLMHPNSEQAKRIYSRLIERCDMVPVKHENRRILKAFERRKASKAL